MCVENVAVNAVAGKICQAPPSKSASESSMVPALGETLRSGPYSNTGLGLIGATSKYPVICCRTKRPKFIRSHNLRNETA